MFLLNKALKIEKLIYSSKGRSEGEIPFLFIYKKSHLLNHKSVFLPSNRSVYLISFQREYLTLVEQCMNFACEMMDLCRGTQEVEAVISDFLEDGANIRDPLGRLRLAIRFEEKKVGYSQFHNSAFIDLNFNQRARSCQL